MIDKVVAFILEYKIHNLTVNFDQFMRYLSTLKIPKSNTFSDKTLQ